jgi:SIT family siderophore-iron:H+ symporter-like MFS transporter
MGMSLISSFILFADNSAWSIQGPFLYTSLIVSFGQSTLAATRISSLFTFTSTLTGMALGLVVMKVRRLKAFIIFGSLTYTLAFGLLIRYRGGHNTSQVSGVIGAEVLLGIGAGFFTYPAIASVQARTKHKSESASFVDLRKD